MSVLGAFSLLLLLVTALGRCGPSAAPEGPTAGASLAGKAPATAVREGSAGRPAASTTATLPTEPDATPTTGRRESPAATTAPARSDPAGPSPLPTQRLRPTQEPTQPQPTQTPISREYTVAAGDSLWTVSRAHGLTVEHLARANGLTPTSLLQVGQRLSIPAAGDKGAAEQGGLRLPPLAEGRLSRPKERPLSELAPGLVSYLRERGGESAAAVYLPKSDTLYTLNPRARFQMASTVKAPIMVTQLSQRYKADPDASTAGSSLVAPMITVSDNEAASLLLARVGGPPAVEAELRARGIGDTDINPEAWGLSTTTAPDMALLMRSLYEGERLNEQLRQLAFGLLGGVVSEQRWGVPAGLPAGSEVAFKGGWLPRDGGWLVHQIGAASVDGEPVIFAFLNKGQPGFEYGKQTLQRSAELLARREGRK